VGLAYGRDHAEDEEAKERVRAVTAQFVQQFDEVNGALRCRDLVGLDIGCEEGLQAYHDRGLHERCSRIVGNAVRQLLDVLDAWETR
jgi:hypothetical protein